MYFYNFSKTDQSISIIVGMLTSSPHLALSVALNISLISLFLAFTTGLLATFLFRGKLDFEGAGSGSGIETKKHPNISSSFGSVYKSKTLFYDLKM